MKFFTFLFIMLIRVISIYSNIFKKFPIKNLINKSKSNINHIKPKLSIILPINDNGKLFRYKLQ